MVKSGKSNRENNRGVSASWDGIGIVKRRVNGKNGFNGIAGGNGMG